MINISKHPTGGYCTSALVLNPKTREVFTDWAVFTGTKEQARKEFRLYLAHHGLVLING